jgi:hypothetical protein
VESARKARDTYNARDTEEGRLVHCAEEADRRVRRARELVGDHRCREEVVGLQQPSFTAQQFPLLETTDAQSGLPAPPPSLLAAEPEPVAERPHATPLPSARTAAEPEAIEWVLVAWPELLSVARRREGTEASCPFCGRRGRIGRVVSLDEWRRWLRHGLEPP